MHQSLQGATFHIEHIAPKASGGLDDPENLALACPSCNLAKSNRFMVTDPESKIPVLLFNPRTDHWEDNFFWDDCRIVGRTAIGRATVEALNLNHPRRLLIREAEKWFNLFPPDNSQ
jgi:hypothetical protein